MHRFIACERVGDQNPLSNEPVLWAGCFECDRGVPCVDIVKRRCLRDLQLPGPPATSTFSLALGTEPRGGAVAAAFDDDYDEQDMQATTPPVAQK